ncbi:hypothetical protein D3218_08775 [Aureimonas flava]|uniref:Uncharacterized protein n=1 Tax=Aureimonas flava TaxID=2320271 RepID=A0A3A1WM42_9HYPH|nr:hypothetical protein [Aureimonas flava]RIY01436.1 hypothetical protein D3218_08775 [Aureimonas flava]
MSEIKRIPLSASVPSDPWLEFGDEKASDLLLHLRRDNLALGRLRDALSADMDTASFAETPHR